MDFNLASKYLNKISRRHWKLLGTGVQALAAGVAMGVVIYSGGAIVTSYMKTREFEEALKKEARLAASDSRPAESIRAELLEKSRELGLEINPEDIAVLSGSMPAQIPIAGMPAIVANPNQNNLPSVGTVNIEVSYTVPISFPLYTWELRFHLQADEHSI